MSERRQKQDNPADPQTILESFLEAGRRALAEGRHAEALTTLRAALELSERTPGMAALTLDILGRLSTVTHRTSGPLAAIPLQRRVVDAYEALHEQTPEDPRLPAALTTLALMYAEADRDDDARETMDRAVSLLEEEGEDGDPVIVAAASAIGEALFLHDTFDDAAERMLKKARAGLLTVQGAEEPETASLAVMLAHYARAGERTDEARSLLEAALPVLEAETPRRAQLAQGLMFFGQVHMDEERYVDAEALFARAEDVYRELLGERAIEALGCLFQRGIACQEQDKLDEAEAIFVRALAEAEASFGREHQAFANIQEAYDELLEQKRQAT